MDKLQLYRGRDVILLSDKDSTNPTGITLHSPTLGEICDYGESQFFSLAYYICSIPTDYMDELDDAGIKYEDLDDYEFFIVTLFKNLQDVNLSILLPNFNPSKLELSQHIETKELVRIDYDSEFVFDKTLYLELTKTLRDLFGFKYQPRYAGTPLTRQKMIEVARQQKLQSKNKKAESVLLPLISSMINCAEFKYNHSEVWDMPFYAFMDSVRRVQAVRTANEMYTGGYFGIKLSEVKEHLNWMRPL